MELALFILGLFHLPYETQSALCTLYFHIFVENVPYSWTVALNLGNSLKFSSVATPAKTFCPFQEELGTPSLCFYSTQPVHCSQLLSSTVTISVSLRKL